MDLISKSQLSAVRANYERTRSRSALFEASSIKNSRKAFTNEITVFLSHKHSQQQELQDAIALLRKVNVNVYVDWADEGMPKTTSGATAQRLKDKIKSSRKFILLATEEAIASTWCNWELGIGDAHRYIDHIALLVVKENYTAWTGSEYLQIYPVIGAKYSNNLEIFEVQYPGGKKVDLITWLNS